MKDFVVSKKQAKEFASAIWRDVHLFCEEHKEEYEAFLREEQNGGNSVELAKYQ